MGLKIIKILVPFLILVIAGSKAHSVEQKACYLITNQLDWGATRLGAADSYIEAAEACHTGDHLTVAELPVRQAGYFIIATCDPAFAITTLDISDSLVSITCVKSHDKELRQN